MSDEAFERRARELYDLLREHRHDGTAVALLTQAIRDVRREALEEAAKVCDEQAKEDAAEAESYEDGEDGQDAHLMCAATCRSVANSIQALGKVSP